MNKNRYMILIAESGSTKTDWVVSDGTVSLRLRTSGINPQLGIAGEIAEEVLAWINSNTKAGEISEFHFYGAGVLPGKAKEWLVEFFKPLFPQACMEFDSDLVAAARATCGDNAGIVAILGTGTNSCFWDGNRIAMHTPSLGYVLGDEGGGAYIGKRLLSDYLKGVMPKPTAEAFAAAYDVTEAEAVRRVYTEPYPNRYMASFVPFVAANIALPGMTELVEEAMTEFVKRNLQPYPTDKYPVNFVGSVAVVFKPQLEKVCQRHALTTGKTVASPVDELVKYHIRKTYGI